MDDALECLTVAIEAGVIRLETEADLRALLAALVVTFPVTLNDPRAADLRGRKSVHRGKDFFERGKSRDLLR
jgi:hypothetical protein